MKKDSDLRWTGPGRGPRRGRRGKQYQATAHRPQSRATTGYNTGPGHGLGSESLPSVAPPMAEAAGQGRAVLPRGPINGSDRLSRPGLTQRYPGPAQPRAQFSSSTRPGPRPWQCALAPLRPARVPAPAAARLMPGPGAAGAHSRLYDCAPHPRHSCFAIRYGTSAT